MANQTAQAHTEVPARRPVRLVPPGVALLRQPPAEGRQPQLPAVQGHESTGCGPDRSRIRKIARHVRPRTHSACDVAFRFQLGVCDQGLWLADSVGRWTLDRLLGAEPKDWNRQALEWAEQRRQRGIAALRKAAAERVAGTQPSLPLEAYAGTYADSLYPTARVTYHQGRLRLVLGPVLAGDLDHWQDDVFRVTWDRADFGANLVSR